MIQNLVGALVLFTWFGLFSLGGIWLARGAFRLRQNEQALVGVSLGFILQNLIVNWLARVFPLPVAAWTGSVLVLALGFGLVLRTDGLKGLKFPVLPAQWLVFAGLVYVYFMLSRGLAIFDDYAHLPTLSIMATGDIPPHFSLDPNIVYGYHYFLLLFSAQVMRVGNLPPWTTLDAGRALSFGLGVMLAALWTQRLTRSSLAGLLGGVMMAFGSGTRWLLLLLPHSLVNWLGRGVVMLGSGSASGPNLASALANPWAVEGAGPMPFPFAFANGIYTPGAITALGPNGIVSFAVIVLMLLVFQRWRNWAGAALAALVFSSWGLLTEVELVVFFGAGIVVALAYAWRRRSFHLRKDLWQCLGIMAAGAFMGLAAGGAWTDLIAKEYEKLVLGQTPASYQTVGFTLAAPAVVSSHLGVLSLFDPAQILIVLLEIGPVVLALPLLAWFGWRAFKLNRWLEAALAASAFLSLVFVFFQFNGSTGVRNTPRLYVFVPICAVLALPLAWWWAGRRSQVVKVVLALVGIISVAGGAVMFGIELLAAQRPVVSYFITALDDQMYQAHWDQLQPGALVFDPDPSRATTLFGRFTDSSTTWYAIKPAWQALRAAMDPVKLHMAGFDYVYLSDQDWNGLNAQQQESWLAACVHKIDEKSDKQGHFRRLLEIGACR